MATYVERLASVETAIARIEAGAQEVRYEGRVVRHADLQVLYAERSRLEPLARAETSPTGGSMRLRYGVPN